MSAHILFRVASSPEVGGGHVSRCFALARAIRCMNADVSMVFVFDQDGEAWIKPACDAGFSAVLEGQEPSGPWAGTIMDGYNFGQREADRLKALSAGGGLIVLDDYCDPPRNADLVICTSTMTNDDHIAGIPALMGFKYALLDGAYECMAAPDITDSVQRVCVSCGRVDSINATGLSLSSLKRLWDRGMRFQTEVILGDGAPNKTIVEQMAAEFNGAAKVLFDVDDMADRLQRADVVIGAGGVGLLERMAAGAPSVTLVIAENQIAVVEAAARGGATISAGAVGDMSTSEFADILVYLFESRSVRQKMAKNAQALVDGGGARRVAGAVLRYISY